MRISLCSGLLLLSVLAGCAAGGGATVAVPVSASPVPSRSISPTGASPVNPRPVAATPTQTAASITLVTPTRPPASPPPPQPTATLPPRTTDVLRVSLPSSVTKEISGDVLAALEQQLIAVIGPTAPKPVAFAEAGADMAFSLDGGTPVYTEVLAFTAPFTTVTDDVDPAQALEMRNTAQVLPFHRLDPTRKVMRINGQHLLDKQADLKQYPLVQRFSIALAPVDPALAAAVAAPWRRDSNRDLAAMTVVAMTGVTALTRGTATMMDRKGVNYPAEQIRSWLSTADLTHISNEVSFVKDCPPGSFEPTVIFCASPKYFELLKYVGTDVVELTGNHLWDYGVPAFGETLDMYSAAGMRTFGGGRNLAVSGVPLTMTVNGNRIAFVGCNPVGPNWATTSAPGSARCGTQNSPLASIIQSIRSLAADGWLVIVGIQYEEYYTYDIPPNQRRDFRALRDAGAVVINGSQGHHAQGFEVDTRSMIHFGVGNLFFGDQLEPGAKQTFVDRHVFYGGRYLGAEIKTAQIEDWSQPRPMSATARAQLLKIVFDAAAR